MWQLLLDAPHPQGSQTDPAAPAGLDVIYAQHSENRLSTPCDSMGCEGNFNFFKGKHMKNTFFATYIKNGLFINIFMYCRHKGSTE
jgi:hypothetical protein